MIFDIIIILIIGMFTVIGLKQGIIKAGISLLGIILVYLIAFATKGLIGNLLCRILPFFNFTGNYEGLTSLNILIYELIGFLLIFGILLSLYMVIVNLSKLLDLAVNLTIILIIPSKILGGILGFIEGYIIVFICLITLSIPMHNVDMFTNSTLVNKILYHSPIITKYTKSTTIIIKESYELGEDIKDNKISKKEANKKMLNTMIKHKIVSKKLVNDLIESKKLKV